MDVRTPGGGTRRAVRTVPSSIINEARRQLAAAGPSARFEVLSLTEPHKFRQSGVLALRRLSPIDTVRDVDFTAETASVLRDDGCAPFDLAAPGQ